MGFTASHGILENVFSLTVYTVETDNFETKIYQMQL